MVNYPLLLIPVIIVLLIACACVRYFIRDWVEAQNWMTVISANKLTRAVDKGCFLAFLIIALIMFIPFMVV